ncbi:MAG: anti-sigma factor [Actinobacteria bacterium]|nr:anti-sigma factor [Actinomycetota bacterium]
MDESIHELSAGYALDALDAPDQALFETHLTGCESCRQELEGFWRVTASLAHGADGPAAAPALRERILVQSRRELPSNPPSTVVPIRRRFALPAAGSFAAVAAVAAIGLGIWAASLSDQVDDLRGELAGGDAAVAILADPAGRDVPLAGADGRVVISSSGKAALVLSGVDEAPEGKTYEIWVIEDGRALPAGLFDRADTHTVLLVGRPVPDDAIVAVTLEHDGGVDAPTSSPLFATRAV